jgi:L-fuconolactonase
MIIVDTHCHAGNNWFEPVELLLFQMNRNDVDKAVLIQHGGTFDANYLFECENRFPGKFKTVVIVDTKSPNAVADLEKWAARGAVGVRLAPGVRSPGSDPLAIWKKAAELGMVISCQGKLSEFASDEFAELVGRFPNMPIIIEHLASVEPDEKPPYSEFKKALALSRFPNTTIKIPGLGEISLRPPVLEPHFKFDYTPPFFELTYDAFGPSRMMWGSDYPPVSGREGYRNALQGVMNHPVHRSESDKEWIMGKTALSVFGFE